jgi:hypothetical protein
MRSHPIAGQALSKCQTIASWRRGMCDVPALPFHLHGWPRSALQDLQAIDSEGSTSEVALQRAQITGKPSAYL